MQSMQQALNEMFAREIYLTCSTALAHQKKHQDDQQMTQADVKAFDQCLNLFRVSGDNSYRSFLTFAREEGMRRKAKEEQRNKEKQQQDSLKSQQQKPSLGMEDKDD